MIHFFLNIEKFYQLEMENGSEIQAVACIEYPIIHVIARTVETMEEEYDELDKFIVQSAVKHGGLSIQQFSELSGLGKGVFAFRAQELIKQEYILMENDVVKPQTKGFEFFSDAPFEREIEKTRSFIIDGVSHQPLRSYFYKDGKENLISEEERDSWGNKLFNPGIIHNPPSKNLVERILNIPIEDRMQYSIPTHLKAIIDYDFVLMTYPLPIVLYKTNEGGINKKIIDGFTRNANTEDIAIWQKSLESEISKTEIIIEEKDVGAEGAKSKKIHFKSNWGNTRTAIDGRIFNITKVKLKHFIQKLFSLQTINENNIFQNDIEIKLKIDKEIFESEGADKIKILEACIRGRDYIRQYEGIGVWLVFLKVSIADDFMQGLVKLYKLLREETSLIDLLSLYNNNYRVLRKDLIAIESLNKLEELDIYLFLNSRDTNFKQNYLSLQSE